MRQELYLRSGGVKMKFRRYNTISIQNNILIHIMYRINIMYRYILCIETNMLIEYIHLKSSKFR